MGLGREGGGGERERERRRECVEGEETGRVVGLYLFRSVVRSPFGLVLEESEGLNGVAFVQGEAVVDLRGGEVNGSRRVARGVFEEIEVKGRGEERRK